MLIFINQNNNSSLGKNYSKILVKFTRKKLNIKQNRMLDYIQVLIQEMIHLMEKNMLKHMVYCFKTHKLTKRKTRSHLRRDNFLNKKLFLLMLVKQNLCQLVDR
jgi:hypothetical protein